MIVADKFSKPDISNITSNNNKLIRFKSDNNNKSNKREILTVNLSSLVLEQSDISLLDRGLTFVPTPKTLPVRSILENKDNLIRNVKLRSFFNKCNKPFSAKQKLF